MSVRLLGMGDNVVDRYFDSGEMYAGGNPVNVAAIAAGLGAQAAYWGVVSTDEAGELVMATLADYGVDTRLVQRTDEPNAVSTIKIDEAGNRSFINPVPNTTWLTPTEDELEAARGFDIVHLGPYARLEHRVADIATRAPVSYDFGEWRSPHLAAILAHVQVATFSTESISAAESDDLILWASAQGPHLVLATSGARGASAVMGHRIVRAAARPVDVVDTTGAGDAFIGAVLASAPSTDDLLDALEMASEVAAQVCTRRGAIGSSTRISLPDQRRPLQPEKGVVR